MTDGEGAAQPDGASSSGAVPRTRWPIAHCAGAGALAGMAVGAVDGVRAGMAVGASASALLATMLLTVSLDGLVGWTAGVACEVLGRLTVWGRGARPPAWARAVGFVVAGAGAAWAAVAVVTGTSLRKNRFLAAGLTALAAIGAGVLAFALAPAVARLAGARRSSRQPPRAPSPALAVVGPPLCGLASAVIFAAVARTRAPLHGPALIERSAWSALAAFLLPLTLSRAAELRGPRWSDPRLWLAAGGVYLLVGALGVGMFWENDLRFAPWAELIAGAAIAALGIGLCFGVMRLWAQRPPRLSVPGVVLGLGLSAVVLRASENEAGRKIASARAALVGPALEAGRALLDFDGDGYARALGGGDCDDSDPDVHPGAVDLPGDGVDADCDGQDATQALPPPARMATLPPNVPADLNLLLVTIDTLRADHLGCYGYARATSPAIDALAAAGTLFENGWAHAPSTRYSMPAIATGRWPSAITWDESIWWPRIGANMRTTAQALHEAGYFTAGMFSFNYFEIGFHRGFERGMDLYRSDRAALHVAVNGPMESRGSSSREMTDDAIAFVDAHRDRRFFLWLHYYDPHLSYEPHPEVPSFGSARVDLYDGEIRFTDLHFGRLLEHLRQTGLWDRTAIVLTGDHGEGFGEHGVTEHGFDLYTAQTRVPFIVRVPGVPPQRVRAPAGHVDIAPTLVNLARGHAEPSFLGRSLVPDIVGPPASDTDTRAVFQEVTSERGKKRAFVTTQRHLIWNETPSGTTECYDRTRDPAEARDIWDVGGDAACATLARDLKRLETGLALPPGAAERLVADVTPPGGSAPVPSHPAQSSLGDLAIVRGYDLAADRVPPGGRIDATIYLAPQRRLERGLRLRYQIEGASGWRRTIDQVPVGGLMPLARWRPGQQIRDRLSVVVPPGAPPGRYTVRVQLMAASTVRAEAPALQVTVGP
ncbi:MAG TPA: sulfatase-like hydrolase/transferase [Polyangia bacterium]|nr:sulfatase-like hydrolase/transferase [Polyangia bacterium]